MSKRRRRQARDRRVENAREPAAAPGGGAEGPAKPRLRRRRVTPSALLATGAALLLCFAAGAFWLIRPEAQTAQPKAGGRPEAERLATSVDASGRLLVPLEGNLALVSLPDRSVSDVVRSGRSGAVTDVRWAPDGKSAAYALYHVKPGDSSASSEIYQTDLVGESRPLVERDHPGATLDSPAWSPDGNTLYFGYSALDNQRLVRRVERLDIVSGVRTVVADGALPGLSPDGENLAMIRSDSGGDALLVSRSDGGQLRTLIPAGRFGIVGAPRFSPDGRTLAVPISNPVGQVGGPTDSGPFGLLDAPVAHAHGDPWDVFLVSVQGGEPRRLTNLLEDEISVAWSPDGTQVGVFGSRGLYLADLTGRTTFALDRSGYGGIDWAR